MSTPRHLTAAVGVSNTTLLWVQAWDVEQLHEAVEAFSTEHADEPASGAGVPWMLSLGLEPLDHQPHHAGSGSGAAPSAATRTDAEEDVERAGLAAQPPADERVWAWLGPTRKRPGTGTDELMREAAAQASDRPRGKRTVEKVPKRRTRRHRKHAASATSLGMSRRRHKRGARLSTATVDDGRGPEDATRASSDLQPTHDTRARSRSTDVPPTSAEADPALHDPTASLSPCRVVKIA